MLAYKRMIWRCGRVGRVVASWLQVVCLKTFEKLIWGIDWQVKAMFKQGKLRAKGSRGSNREECEDRSYKVKILCGGGIKPTPDFSLVARRWWKGALLDKIDPRVCTSGDK